MTPEQEDFALRSCHPLYDAFCREDEPERKEEDELARAEEEWERREHR